MPSAAAARIESPAEREERRAVAPSARWTVAELGKHGGSEADGDSGGGEAEGGDGEADGGGGDGEADGGGGEGEADGGGGEVDGEAGGEGGHASEPHEYFHALVCATKLACMSALLQSLREEAS